MKESRSKIKIPIYDSEIILILTDDVFASTKKVMKKNGQVDPNFTREKCASAYTLYDDSDIGYYTIILPRKLDMFLLIHESQHTGNIILDHHEVIYDINNHDAFTYLVSFIGEHIYNKIGKLK